jgi:hypothetical protein
MKWIQLPNNEHALYLDLPGLESAIPLAHIIQVKDDPEVQMYGDAMPGDFVWEAEKWTLHPQCLAASVSRPIEEDIDVMRKCAEKLVDDIFTAWMRERLKGIADKGGLKLEEIFKTEES